MPIPVDEAGLDVAALARTKVDAVVVTPAHHFPTGAVMSAERRAALVAWAKDRGALILEDDYDAEYRYDREPIGALHGLAPEQVIYGVGKQDAAPGLRLGWMLILPRLVEPIAVTKEHVDRGPPGSRSWRSPTSCHAASSTTTCAGCGRSTGARRDLLLDVMRRELPELRPVGHRRGCTSSRLPPGVDEAAAVRRAASAGVGVYGLSRYGYARNSDAGGLIFGWGSHRNRDCRRHRSGRGSDGFDARRSGSGSGPAGSFHEGLAGRGRNSALIAEARVQDADAGYRARPACDAPGLVRQAPCASWMRSSMRLSTRIR